MWRRNQQGDGMQQSVGASPCRRVRDSVNMGGRIRTEGALEHCEEEVNFTSY